MTRHGLCEQTWQTTATAAGRRCLQIMVSCPVLAACTTTWRFTLLHLDVDESRCLFGGMSYTRKMKLAERTSGMNEQTITFDNGAVPTKSEYDEYIKRQLAWLDGLPPLTPEDGDVYDLMAPLH